jgi:hypothetical protein
MAAPLRLAIEYLHLLYAERDRAMDEASLAVERQYQAKIHELLEKLEQETVR